MTAKGGWDPQQYGRFRAERARPFFDLMALVQQRDPARVLDLGCGSGELTAKLHDTLGALETLGVDSSASMLGSLGADTRPAGMRLLQADIADVARLELEDVGAESVDVLFSNAALHWLTDHEVLFTQLRALLTPGAELAVQVPAMHHAPTFRIAVEMAQSPPFRDALGGFVQRYGVLEPSAYARLLHRLGFVEQRVRLEVYAHVLPSREAVFEWVKGSTLTPYAKRLPPKVYESFLGHYRERLMLSLKDERPFLFPFERILMWGRLPG